MSAARMRTASIADDDRRVRSRPRRRIDRLRSAARSARGRRRARRVRLGELGVGRLPRNQLHEAVEAVLPVPEVPLDLLEGAGRARADAAPGRARRCRTPRVARTPPPSSRPQRLPWSRSRVAAITSKSAVLAAFFPPLRIQARDECERLVRPRGHRVPRGDRDAARRLRQRDLERVEVGAQRPCSCGVGGDQREAVLVRSLAPSRNVTASWILEVERHATVRYSPAVLDGNELQEAVELRPPVGRARPPSAGRHGSRRGRARRGAGMTAARRLPSCGGNSLERSSAHARPHIRVAPGRPARRSTSPNASALSSAVLVRNPRPCASPRSASAVRRR